MIGIWCDWVSISIIFLLNYWDMMCRWIGYYILYTRIKLNKIKIECIFIYHINPTTCQTNLELRSTVFVWDFVVATSTTSTMKRSWSSIRACEPCEVKVFCFDRWHLLQYSNLFSFVFRAFLFSLKGIWIVEWTVPSQMIVKKTYLMCNKRVSGSDGKDPIYCEALISKILK